MLKSYQLEDRRDLESETLRLKRQAEILYRFEANVFRTAFAGYDRHLLDLGCGNGSFTSLVSDQFAQVTGVDINNELLARARSQHPKIDFLSIRDVPIHELEGWLIKAGPSAVLMRFVVQHLNPEEWCLLKLVAKYCVSHCVRLVIADVDDSEIMMHPAASTLAGYFNRLTCYIAERGGCRLLNGWIRDLFSAWDIPILRRDRVEVVFGESNSSDFRAIFLPGLVRANPKSLPQELETAFDNFFANGGRLHIPMFYHVL